MLSPVEIVTGVSPREVPAFGRDGLKSDTIKARISEIELSYPEQENGDSACSLE
jgi:hypothetical protein